MNKVNIHELRKLLKDHRKRNRKWRKQRWKFTKVHWQCQLCDEKLDARSKYHRSYGFCNVDCGMALYGLSYRDFY